MLPTPIAELASKIKISSDPGGQQADSLEGPASWLSSFG
jgi:hypothetical protein